MEKRKYAKPLLNCEAFVPSEYIAVCFELACNTTSANSYEASIGNDDANHRNSVGNCGHKESQIINTTKDGIITQLYEHHRTGNMWTGYYYVDLPIESELIGKNIKDYNNKTITWQTYYNDITYHHQGVVTMVKSPNHS